MKRFVSVLAGLLVLPAFAEILPPYYYGDVAEYADAEYVEDDEDFVEETAEQVVAPTTAGVNPRSATNGRAPVSRTMPATANTTAVNSRNVAASRGVASRTNPANVARTATRTTAARGVSGTHTNTRTISRSNNSATGLTTRANANNANRTVAARAASVGSSSIVQTDTVNKALYNSRAGVRTSSVTSRVPSVRVSSGISTVNDTLTVDTSAVDLDELAQMTDFCKAQYAQCMDNFCNILDDSQGRCSCSANLKNYEKTELALKQATEELQSVAQQIQYIGLSGDEVVTLFNQTEAEAAMQSTNDNTQLKNDLDKIKKMIVDVRSGSSTTDAGLNMDFSGLFDITIDSIRGDLGGFNLFGNNGTNSSISNQRGETLYKTAIARCKAAVLNSCSAQGVDTALITNSYDLEIDKACIVYERSLSESNDQMASTVRNAKAVLQKARLMVAQQKNQYDMRGCINALDACMQDEFVCGDDYENCLDMTGKYIVNGEVVIGSQPGLPGDEKSPFYSSMWGEGDDSAWGNKSSLSEFIENNIEGSLSAFPIKTPKNMAAYIQQKIGYIDKNGKAMGMCVSVLNKCQDYTFSGKNASSRQYDPANEVVRGYLERVLIQIKASQDTILADYAEDCISDVASCISANNGASYSYLNGGNYYSDSTDNITDVAIRACRSQISTCRSLTEYSADDTDRDWLMRVFSVYTNAASRCTTSGGSFTMPGNNGAPYKCECANPLESVSGNIQKTNGEMVNGTVACQCPTGKKFNGTTCI